MLAESRESHLKPINLSDNHSGVLSMTLSTTAFIMTKLGCWWVINTLLYLSIMISDGSIDFLLPILSYQLHNQSMQSILLVLLSAEERTEMLMWPIVGHLPHISQY